MNAASRFPRWHGSLVLLLALLLLQATLWINPGYFSHDELQWAARANQASVADLPFVPFADVTAFQYRPLTFNLWLLLSYFLFDTPPLFHAVFVLAGSLNAVLLASVLRRAGLRPQVSFCAALVFGLSPFAVWVHGWVGCLADLLWLALGLGIVWTLQRLHSNAIPAWRSRRILLAASVAAVATALALLAKEAALSIPALLGLGAVFLRLPRLWLAATVGSGVMALLYLALRLDTLTSPGEATTYSMQWLAWPQRWAEYMVFPWALGMNEVHVMQLLRPSRWLVLALAPLALSVCLWRASPRLWLAWLAGGVLALGPVLVLPASSNQYAYGFAALCCAVVAMAWDKLHRRGHVTLALLALVVVVHGFQVQKNLFNTGRLQAVFSPSLAAQAQAQPQGPIRLWPERAGSFHVYARLSHDIPAWQDVRLGKRVSMASSASEATHLIARNGHVYRREEQP